MNSCIIVMGSICSTKMALKVHVFPFKVRILTFKLSVHANSTSNACICDCLGGWADVRKRPRASEKAHGIGHAGR